MTQYKASRQVIRAAARKMLKGKLHEAKVLKRTERIIRLHGSPRLPSCSAHVATMMDQMKVPEARYGGHGF